MICGGGTAGHLYPALSLASAIREADPDARVVFMGSTHGIEARLLPESGEEHRLLPVRGMPRKSPLAMLGFIWRLKISVLSAIRHVRRDDPDVVVGVGGYASAPGLLAGMLSRRPTVIHEQNSIPGVVNRRLGGRVTLVALSFKASRRAFKREKGVIVTGNPLKSGILKPVTRAEAAVACGVDSARFTVLVFGGSRGARRLSLSAIQAAPTLVQRGMQIIVITGKDDHELALKELNQVKSQVDIEPVYLDGKVRLIPWWESMENLYAAADVVVSRAGAGTISELCALGKASILVPYPHAADDHQARNADILVSEGAARSIPDSQLDAERLIREVSALQQDRAALAAVADAARGLGRPEAASELAAAVIQLAQEHVTRRKIGVR